jgi:thiosulfate/3-mercaptopyruvate sulfurtransferase
VVSTDWLGANLQQPGLVVVDASWYLPSAGRDPQAEYLAAHIPGAVFYDLDRISDPDTDLPHMLGSPVRFAAAMGALGIGDDNFVVAYDGSGANLSAARVWWTLKVFGHDAAAVLDGGFQAWQREGRPVESGKAARPPERFTPRYRAELVRSKSQVNDALAAGTEQLLDARSAGRFQGQEPEPRPGLKSGHVPGSHNLPFPDLVGPDGKLLPRPELEQRLRQAGIDLDRPVITTCGSGVSACALLLALEQVGHRDHALYDGSWAEYGKD